MSPSVDAIKRLSPDRPATRSLCLKVSGAVAPSALVPRKVDASLSRVAYRTITKMHGFGNHARLALREFMCPLWSHPCQEEAPKMPLPDAIFCQVDVVC